ncbi:MAG: deoxyribose-phosphate aldolase, partial [Rhodothermaceae bacterium]|nr:deoxyribose-phosphate aldolase [Rhodothermaceae bacterium]
MIATDFQRNTGTELDLGWVRNTHVNPSAIRRRASTLATRRSVKKQWQAAWLLRAITCLDLTTLSGDDTQGNVVRLCAKARQPVRTEILKALEADDINLTVGAVCVYHARVREAVEALQGTSIPVAAVSTGFPAGLSPFKQRIEEIVASVEAGAKEIDIVITREHVLRGNWTALYDEVKEMRQACGDAHMKAILATGELGTLWNVAKASKIAMMAGSDFIKTSTGKEPVNATIPVGLIMTRMIREYEQRSGQIVGFKPAGGIRKAKEALLWLALMKEELGDR